MLANESLTESQWQIAHTIAHTLVKEETDVNELGKAIAYLRNAVNQNQSDAGLRFFKYLKTLVSNGRQIGHSGRTPDYYRSIDKVCSQYFQNQQGDAHTILQILGWAARLMRYYDVAPVAELPITLPKKCQFQITNVLEARVIKKANKGSKVTYEVTGEQYNEKEPKNFAIIPENGMVKVQIVSLKTDGSINHVKFIKQ
jgi:hypothetical protein